ncbi:hypothetical protein [Flaviaesturariibacter aridisoli]|uniref:Uncharacterized protein n=1 Tax=Flaviaesturariibacter aridisoli TaxID=2545761 RepID=A0A4R4DU36_9BACT|nr:hypothetical protein [Flaviaesturariibacter aridisoli]TCZ66433.1 hypothetical protein E0486_16760 [Flaviaesturariibacter aridisoli]
MWELGVLQLVADKCKIANVINYRKAAAIISSFSGLNEDTIRKGMVPLFRDDLKDSNNPLKASKNQSFIENFKRTIGGA